ncbi:hypothetical protein [Pantoea sp. 18069]|uniref:hypothetical protein n=1 Tax=Pantoea sp. 18069 TaxID=2681415 RepID=UPI00135C405C|nr:hypothetical protein [Pantoea sp. 18069]
MTTTRPVAPDFDLRTSKGGRGYVAWYFANELKRHDFTRYINDTLAADFACVLANRLQALRATPGQWLHQIAAPPVYAPLKLEEVRDLTAMHAGAPWSEEAARDLRDYRSGKLPIEKWRGKRPPTVTWRKAISMMGRQRNHQHRVEQTRARMTERAAAQKGGA